MSDSRSFPRETIALRGLIGVELTRPSGKAQIKFETPLDPLFPLKVGAQHELVYAAHIEGDKPIRARMTIAAVEALRHVIGTCTYEALLVGSVTQFENGAQTPLRYDVYLPALQAVVKSTTFDAATNALLELESFEFDSIAAR